MVEEAAGARVVMRRLQRADAAELIALNRENVAYHAPWEKGITEQSAFDAWFARGLTGATVSLIAHEAATNAVVGVINVNDIVMGVFRSAYLGYWGYAHTGRRGLMTEALRLAVRVAFDELGLHRVEANIQPGNARSIALVQRAGFTREGFSPQYLFLDGAWRDHERWALVTD
jgi:ribosomal-protein-alanine N-acetyltransferase